MASAGLRPAVAAFIGLLLGACSIAPFEVQEAGKTGKLSPQPRPGFQGPYQPRPVELPGEENPWAQPKVPPEVFICYGSLFTSPEDVLAAAREFCPQPGYRLELSRQTTFLNACPLLQPNLASFTCTKAEK